MALVISKVVSDVSIEKVETSLPAGLLRDASFVWPRLPGFLKPLPDEEARELLKEVNGILKGGAIQDFPTMEIKGQSYCHRSSNLVTQVGSLLFVSAGDPERLANEMPQSFKRHLARLHSDLEPVLQMYPGNIAITGASSTLESNLRRFFPLGPHTVFMSAVLLAQSDRTEGCATLDLGCGDGILSQIFALTGAQKLFLLDYDPPLVELGKAFLGKLNTRLKRALYLDTKPFSADLGQVNLWRLDELSHLRRQVQVAVVNIGPFYADGKLSERVLTELSFWPKIKTIFSGGYLTTEPAHQRELEQNAAFLQDSGFSVAINRYRQIANFAASR